MVTQEHRRRLPQELGCRHRSASGESVLALSPHGDHHPRWRRGKHVAIDPVTADRQRQARESGSLREELADHAVEQVPLCLGSTMATTRRVIPAAPPQSSYLTCGNQPITLERTTATEEDLHPARLVQEMRVRLVAVRLRGSPPHLACTQIDCVSVPRPDRTLVLEIWPTFVATARQASHPSQGVIDAFASRCSAGARPGLGVNATAGSAPTLPRRRARRAMNRTPASVPLAKKPTRKGNLERLHMSAICWTVFSRSS